MTIDAHRHGQRYDSAADWASINPVLGAGELGVESDTLKVKIGDGATQWTGLPYALDLVGVATEGYVDDEIAALSATYLAKALADAAGDLLVADGADSWVRLAKGSALQVLRVNAGATGLEYATPAAGALTKIATATGTGSSGVLSFSSIPATYGALLLVWILEATGAGTLCRLRFNGDTGNNYTFGNNVTQSGIALNTPPSTTDILYGFCLIPGYAQTSEEKGVLGIHQYWGGSSGTAAQQETQKAGWASTAAINAIEVAITANSFSTLAKVQLYGLEA